MLSTQKLTMSNHTGTGTSTPATQISIHPKAIVHCMFYCVVDIPFKHHDTEKHFTTKENDYYNNNKHGTDFGILCCLLCVCVYAKETRSIENGLYCVVKAIICEQDIFEASI